MKRKIKIKRNEKRVFLSLYKVGGEGYTERENRRVKSREGQARDVSCSRHTRSIDQEGNCSHLITENCKANTESVMDAMLSRWLDRRDHRSFGGTDHTSAGCTCGNSLHTPTILLVCSDRGSRKSGC